MEHEQRTSGALQLDEFLDEESEQQLIQEVVKEDERFFSLSGNVFSAAEHWL